MVAELNIRGHLRNAVMDELKKAKNIIIFDDNVGLVQQERWMLQIFSNALSRGELQCIGATTIAGTESILKKTVHWTEGSIS